jgi:peptidoglycan hydrolase CwlO-like protein
MEKIRKFLKGIAQFFSSLFSLTSYVETQKNVDDTLLKINENLSSISANMTKMGTQLADTSAKLDSLDGELTKVKDGL